MDWLEAGSHLVGPGIHRIPLALPNDGLRAVNAYTIEDGSGLVLIDPGWATESTETTIRHALGLIGCSLSDVRQVLATHAHPDHYGFASKLRQESAVPLRIGLGERATVERMKVATRLTTHIDLLFRAGAPDLARRVEASGYGRVDVGAWAFPDGWLSAGRPIVLTDRELSVVPTPGHTAGHVSLADLENGFLFSGDHLLPDITPSIGFEACPEQFPLQSYLASLALVAALPDLAMLPAHGPTGGSSRARSLELLAHHETRLALCLDAVSGGASTAFEVARVLRWTRHGRSLQDLDDMNALLAVCETLAHLDLLVLQGALAMGAGGLEATYWSY